MIVRFTFSGVKKALFLAVAGLGFSSTSAIAQSQLYIGLTAGPQLTNIESDFGKYKGTFGYNGGLTTEWRIGRNFALGVDALYTKLGASRTHDQTSLAKNKATTVIKYRTTESFTYFQFALLPKFILPLGADAIVPYDKPGDYKIFLNFFAGPYYAMRTAYSSKGKASGYVLSASADTVLVIESADYKSGKYEAERVAPDDLGVLAGAGINFNLNGGRTVLGFEGRYSRSLLTFDLGNYKEQFFANLEQTEIRTQYAEMFHTALAFNVSLKFRILPKS